FIQLPSQHRAVFPPGEFYTLAHSVARMVSDLDQACHQSIDPPDAPSLPIVQIVKTGGRGRPMKNIDPTFLAHALSMRGPTAVARLLKCSPRHVRRQAVKHGLRDPGPPVIVHVHHPDGSTTRHHRSVTAPVSTLSDHALDALVAHTLTFVTHCFVDGHSRFVTGIRVHTNNRAETVLILFL
ncbi:hypothetical protein K466DRAFT_459051, partial [Polyporus arcularius HHB13444]